MSNYSKLSFIIVFCFIFCSFTVSFADGEISDAINEMKATAEFVIDSVSSETKYIIRPVKTETPTPVQPDSNVSDEISGMIERISRMHENYYDITEENSYIGSRSVFGDNFFDNTPVPYNRQPIPTPTPVKTGISPERLKTHYIDYYFVIESSLRYMEYNIQGYNNAICGNYRGEVSRYRSEFAAAILDIDVLMGELNLYNDLDIWDMYRYFFDNPQCGIYHDGLVMIKTAMDRLHRQTERLGLWVPSTGHSDMRMENAHCEQGFYTAPNGVCLSETGQRETRFWHSNGYPVYCDYRGYCNDTKVIPMDRCEWQNCQN